MIDPAARLTEWVTSVVESLGYVGVAALVALENLLPPVPSELILPLAGFLTGRDRPWFPGMVVAPTAGSVAGALLNDTIPGRSRCRMTGARPDDHHQV